MGDRLEIKELINSCLLPKLSKSYDESQNHVEFEIRNKKLNGNYQDLLKKLEKINLKDPNSENIISYLLILYFELLSSSSWNNSDNSKLANKLNYYFQVYYDISIKNVIVCNKQFNHQKIFDQCMENLHVKLTSSCFKKYPSQIEVYCSLAKELKSFKVSVVPSKVLPASLHLIDDHIIDNKIKGLQCCLSVLHCLTEEHFQEGNYYEVIYLTLKKVISQKNIEASKLVFECLTALYKNLPTTVKHQILDDMYVSILDELYMESNLYRKVECLRFTRTLISIHKIHCVNNSTFQTIIADNLDLCCNETVSEILLSVTLQTFKDWIKYCWCIWELPAGHKILSNLLKILYCCKDDNLVLEVQNLIITLITLCRETEQTNIVNSFRNIDSSLNKVFLNRLCKIINDIIIYNNVLFKNINIKIYI